MEKIYLLVIDYIDRWGNSEQTIKAYAQQKAAKAAYDYCVKESKEEYSEYFDSNGNFKEEEYGDTFACDEFVGGPEGESFSFYEDGCYKTEHYTVYWKVQKIIA